MQQIIDVQNDRAPQMWDLISGAVDFQDKFVADIGCGRGDLTLRLALSGARAVYAIDQDADSLRALSERIVAMRGVLPAPIFVTLADAERWAIEGAPIHFDVLLCCSMLPYAADREAMLKALKDWSDVAIIECQYADDGIGYVDVPDDKAMRALLKRAGWKGVKAIGSTYVPTRAANRTIWRCTKRSEESA